jgi:hypothetical protein
MPYLAERIVEGEKIAIASPCNRFGEMAKADTNLTDEYVNVSRQVSDFFSGVLCEVPIVLIDNVTDYLYGPESRMSSSSWTLDDLPVVTPPFTSVFLETRSPRKSEVEDIRSWGALFTRSDAVNEIEYGEIRSECAFR